MYLNISKSFAKTPILIKRSLFNKRVTGVNIGNRYLFDNGREYLKKGRYPMKLYGGNKDYNHQSYNYNLYRLINGKTQ